MPFTKRLIRVTRLKFCLKEAKSMADWLYEQAEQKRQEVGQLVAIAQAQE